MSLLLMVNITNPENPTVLGHIFTDGWAYGVTLSEKGDEAYVTDLNNGLVILDLEIFD